MGRLLADRGWEACTLFDVTYRPDRLSPEALERGFRNLVKMVYGPGATRRRNEIRAAVWGHRMGTEVTPCA